MLDIKRIKLLINGKKTKEKYIKNKKAPTKVTDDEKRYAIKLSVLFEKEDIDIDMFFEITKKLIVSKNHHKYRDLNNEEFLYFKKTLYTLYIYGFTKVQIGFLIVNVISDSRIGIYIAEYATNKDIEQYDYLIYIDNYSSKNMNDKKLIELEKRLDSNIIFFSYNNKTVINSIFMGDSNKRDRGLRREGKLKAEEKEGLKKI